MRLMLELGVADLAATRFAVSPLHETLRALPLLASPDQSAMNRPWVRWALAELDRQPLRMPRVWPLLVTGLPYMPEFLFPAPPGKSPDLDEELAAVCATPAGAVRTSLRNVFGEGPWPDTATDLSERPAESLAEIAAEVADYHDRLIAPHWERIRSVLDADISYHAGLLAGVVDQEGHQHPDHAAVPGPGRRDGMAGRGGPGRARRARRARLAMRLLLSPRSPVAGRTCRWTRSDHRPPRPVRCAVCAAAGSVLRPYRPVSPIDPVHPIIVVD
jgi:hypothetical protein